MRTPNTSTPARRTAVALEDQIRRDALETGAIIDRSGALLVRRQGQPDRVAFSVGELRAAASGTFTHNHPGGYTFSVSDVALASEFRIAELRVVTRDHRHGMSGLPMMTSAQWQAEFDGALKAVISRTRDDVRTGRLHPGDFGAELAHRAWTEIANRLKFDYWRERS